MTHQAEIVQLHTRLPKAPQAVGAGVSHQVSEVLERHFSGSDVLGAIVSIFEPHFKRDGIPVESVLKADMRNPNVYETLLTGLFDVIIERFFPKELKIEGYDIYKNTIEVTHNGNTYIYKLKFVVNPDFTTDVHLEYYEEGQYRATVAMFASGKAIVL